MDSFVEVAKHNMTTRVRMALRRTRQKMPSFYSKMLVARSELEGGIGATYSLKSEKIESFLMSYIWFQYEHPEIPANRTAFRTTLLGRVGVVPLAGLPQGTEFTLIDPKRTGSCELLLEGTAPRRDVSFTTLILYLDPIYEEEIVLDFFPGEPIKASRRAGLDHGKVVGLEEARRLGFVTTRVV